MLPALREALNIAIWALRQLNGQVHSLKKARDMGVLPGSHSIDKRTLKRIAKELVRGLSLLEGCLPISHLNPGLHHLINVLSNALAMCWFAV